MGEKTQENQGKAGFGILSVLTFFNILGGFFVALVVAALLGFQEMTLLGILAAGPAIGGFASARGGARIGAIFLGCILAALPWIIAGIRIAALLEGAADMAAESGQDISGELEEPAEVLTQAFMVLGGFVGIVGLIGGALGRIGQGDDD